MSHDFRQAALDYHAKPTPGKIRVELSKPAETQRDLARAWWATKGRRLAGSRRATTATPSAATLSRAFDSR